MNPNPSREYIKSLTKEQRLKICVNICSDITLWQIGKGGRNPSMKLLAQLQKRSRGRINAKDFQREAAESVLRKA